MLYTALGTAEQKLVLTAIAAWVNLPAFAHQMSKSAVLLDFRSHDVEAELQLPIDRL
ncbi:MAG: hypothetical protein ACRYHQ_13585 [Janthinobacterium lividum]